MLRLMGLAALLAAFGIVSSCLAAELGVFKPLKPGTQDLLRLQDFCIFRHDGYTYVASMKKDLCNEGIIVARSKDLKSWSVLGDAVTTRTAEDKSMVWAPHVVEDNGMFYMFYTGVTTPSPGQWCQRILVASTKDPSKPSGWQRDNSMQFVVDGKTQSWFRPSHKGAVWTDSAWADCRDPMVLKHQGKWYMFYSGTDSDGGIAGVATAPSVTGPWTDQGAVMKVTPGIPESCFVIEAPDSTFVMTFNHACQDKKLCGSKSARGKSLVPADGKPPFGDVRPLNDSSADYLKGWAHEFIQAETGGLTCANLTGYFVTFQDARLLKLPYGWDVRGAPQPPPSPSQSQPPPPPPL